MCPWEPRKAIADDIDEDFDDPFAGPFADEGLELAQVAELERF